MRSFAFALLCSVVVSAANAQETNDPQLPKYALPNDIDIATFNVLYTGCDTQGFPHITREMYLSNQPPEKFIEWGYDTENPAHADFLAHVRETYDPARTPFTFYLEAKTDRDTNATTMTAALWTGEYGDENATLRDFVKYDSEPWQEVDSTDRDSTHWDNIYTEEEQKAIIGSYPGCDLVLQ